MISITRATEQDYQPIAHIGRSAVELAHRESCSAEAMTEFLDSHYNDEAIREELRDPGNSYHILRYNGMPAGFSKIVLNASHPNIPQANVTKLDRIYLLSAFYDRSLGHELLEFNKALAESNGQCGIWLFTWVGNTRAVNFYLRTGFRIIGSHQFRVTDTHYNQHHQMLLDLA